MIAWRLDAVAASNFVVALYHPKSFRRTQQIPQALLPRHRRPDTPVAVAKSAYRRRERIGFITLDNMSECDIGMLTTVLIGNSQTLRAAQPDGHAARLRLQVRPQRQWHHPHWRESRTLALHRPGEPACPPCRWHA